MTATTRALTTGLVAGALLTLGAGAAHADGEPVPLRQTELAAASQAAATDSGLDLARRVATLESGHPAGNARVVAGSSTQVHVLARDFVADGTGPVGDLGYVATTTRVGDQEVSVWSARTKGGAWRAVNAATGDLEAAMERRAKGAQLLNEPQVGAWYAVRGERVRPLNAAAREVVGGGVDLAEYQRIVHDRYADKLPGSAYDRAGTAGGFEPASAPVTAAGEDAPPPTGALAGLGGIGLLAAGGLLVRRRRQPAP